QPAAQVVRDRQPVGRDAAVLRRRHLGRGVADELSAVVVLDEVLEQQLAPLGRRRPVLERRVQRGGLALLRDDQGAAGAAGRRGLLHGRRAGGQEGRED